MQQQRCALLTFFIGLLLLTVHCGDEVVAPTSGAAGKVISATGEVTATRGDEETRTLKENDIIYVEDTVKTGADSSVTIELSHNRAAWSLNANETRRTNESIAWSAAKQKASAYDNSETTGTAVAASNTGKTAGETASTAMANEKAKVAVLAEDLPTKASSPPAEDPAPTASPAPAAKVEKKKKRKSRRDGIQGDGRSGNNAAPGGGGGGGGGGPVPELSVSKKVVKTKGKTNPVVTAPRGNSAPRGTRTSEPTKSPPKPASAPAAPSPPPPPMKRPAPPPIQGPKVGSVENKDQARTQAATRALIKKTAKACHKKHGGSGDLRYKLIVNNGKFKSFTTTQSSALTPIATCMKKTLKTSKLKGIGSASGRIEI